MLGTVGRSQPLSTTPCLDLARRVVHIVDIRRRPRPARRAPAPDAALPIARVTSSPDASSTRVVGVRRTPRRRTRSRCSSASTSTCVTPGTTDGDVGQDPPGGAARRTEGRGELQERGPLAALPVVRRPGQHARRRGTRADLRVGRPDLDGHRRLGARGPRRGPGGCPGTGRRTPPANRRTRARPRRRRAAPSDRGPCPAQPAGGPSHSAA